MWSKVHSKRVQGVQPEKVWQVWCDVKQWHTWQSDIDYATLDGEFIVGSTINMKLKDGPEVAFDIVEIASGRQFTDVTRFPGARMYDCHEIINHGDAIEVRTTIRIEGILAFLWRKIVAENVANGMAAQTDALIEKARHV